MIHSAGPETLPAMCVKINITTSRDFGRPHGSI